jgi:hypothetical protein
MQIVNTHGRAYLQSRHPPQPRHKPQSRKNGSKQKISFIFKTIIKPFNIKQITVGNGYTAIIPILENEFYTFPYS